MLLLKAMKNAGTTFSIGLNEPNQISDPTYSCQFEIQLHDNHFDSVNLLAPVKVAVSYWPDIIIVTFTFHKHMYL